MVYGYNDTAITVLHQDRPSSVLSRILPHCNLLVQTHQSGVSLVLGVRDVKRAGTGFELGLSFVGWSGVE
jgi:hypothetical protein